MEKNIDETLRNLYSEILKFGFLLKDEYINEFLDHNNENNEHNNEKTFVSIKKRLLEIDIRNISKPFFPLEINSSMDGIELKGPVVLQIVKVENITQPLRRRDENTQPRLLAIQVSDGTTKVTGIEIEQLSDINASTPPGGKILFMGGIIRFGKLLFTPNNVKYLGGVVNHLLEAYQANKIAQKLRSIGINQKSRGIEGPPQFEIKLINMKSVDVIRKAPEKKDKDKNTKQDKIKTNNNEFCENDKRKDQQIDQLLLPPPPPTKKNANNDHIENKKDLSATNGNETGRKFNHGGRDRGKGRNDHGGRGRGRNDHGGRGRFDRGGRGRIDHRERGQQSSSNSQKVTPVISFLENDFPALSICKNTSWKCRNCTFQNSEYLNVCEMCNSNK